MKITTYKCDICRDAIENLQELVGCDFSGMKTFKLRGPRNTDGVHICLGCLRQICEQGPALIAIKDGPVAVSAI